MKRKGEAVMYVPAGRVLKTQKHSEVVACLACPRERKEAIVAEVERVERREV